MSTTAPFDNMASLIVWYRTTYQSGDIFIDVLKSIRLVMCFVRGLYRIRGLFGKLYIMIWLNWIIRNIFGWIKLTIIIWIIRNIFGLYYYAPCACCLMHLLVNNQLMLATYTVLCSFFWVKSEFLMKNIFNSLFYIMKYLGIIL